MSSGLDELIEWLVGEVSYFGDGCPISEILVAIKKHQSKAVVDDGTGLKKKAPGAQRDVAESSTAGTGAVSESDLKLARIIWKWFISRTQVNVGPNGEWNHLSIDTILAIPEEPPKSSPVDTKNGKGKKPAANPGEEDTSAAKDNQPQELIVKDGKQKQSTTKSSTKGKKLPKFQPRVYVDVETTWKTLTGHGIDYKRVPNLEWKCLIGIGSSKEEGIAQPDLVRLIGQDKRSVPKRTGFLEQKGYIVKRTTMLRGMKTSRLWLVKFAPALPAAAGTGFDLSNLTKNVDAVPWSHQWTGDTIDMVSLCQTMLAVVKIWGTIRIKELKQKLGILGMLWQMKVMSRELRRFCAMGAIKYTAARFNDGRHIFKDCVEYIKELTSEEWELFLATGKKSSKYSDQTRDKEPKPNAGSSFKAKAKAKAKGKKSNKSAAATGSETEVVEVLDSLPEIVGQHGWTPEKPLINTVVDLVQAAGSVGYSNPQISITTVGFAFRRHMFTHLNTMCVPGVQPPHLQQYQMSTRKVRTGKTTQFVYSIASAPTIAGLADDKAPAKADADTAQESAASAISVPVRQDSFGFSAIRDDVFAEDGSANISELSRKAGLNTRFIERLKKGPVPKNSTLAAAGTVGRARIQPVVDAPKKKKGRPRNPDKPARVPGQHKTRGRPRKTRPTTPEEWMLSDEPETPVGRPSKRRRVTQAKSYFVPNEEDGTEQPETSVANLTRKRKAAHRASYAGLIESEDKSDELHNQESGEELDQSLHRVYIGEPNSLDPPNKKGRPRKSCVVIFRFTQLKDLDFLSRGDEAASTSKVAPKAQSGSDATVRDQADEMQVDEPQHQPQELAGGDIDIDDSTIVVGAGIVNHEDDEAQSPESLEAVATGSPVRSAASLAADPAPVESSAEPSAAPKKKGRKKKGTPGARRSDEDPWVCEKCGGTWKNDIGLKYHLEKSKTTCNPAMAEDPEKMKRKIPVNTRRMSTPPLIELQKTQIKDDEPSRPTSSNRSASKPLSESPAAPVRSLNLLPRRRFAAGSSGLRAPRGVQKSSMVTVITEEDSDDVETLPAIAAPVTGTITGGSDTFVDGSVQAQPTESQRPFTPSNATGYQGQKKPQLASMRSVEQKDLRDKSHDGSQTADGSARPNQVTPRSTMVSQRQSPQSARSKNKKRTSSTTAKIHPSSRSSVAALHITNGSVTPTGPSSTARKSLPTTTAQPSKPGFSGLEVASTVSEVPQLYATGDAGALPAFKMPEDLNYTKLSVVGLRSVRLQEIIKYTLDNNNGVFPGGETLHLVVSRIYLEEFPDEDPIKTQAVYAAVKKLHKLKVLKEITFACRTEKGIWTSSDLIINPDMAPNDPLPTMLKERMRKAFPNPYMPEAFVPTEKEKVKVVLKKVKNDSRRGLGPGRRDHKLSESIAVLNAPYYEKVGPMGVRVPHKRRMDDSEEDDFVADDSDYVERTRGRPRTGVSEGGPTASELPGTPRRGRKKAVGNASSGTPSDRRSKRVKLVKGLATGCDDTMPLIEAPTKYSATEGVAKNPGVQDLPASFFSTSGRFTFVAWSEVLDEGVEQQGQEQQVDILKQTSLPTANEMKLALELEGRELAMRAQDTFAKTAELRNVEGSQGSWPAYSLKWWRENEVSFTMKGWMPDQRSLSLQNLPTSAEAMALHTTSHFSPGTWIDPAYGIFHQTVQGCRNWESSEKGIKCVPGSVVPGDIFINHSSIPAVSNMAPMAQSLQWNDENAWTVQTLPYDKLRPLEEFEQSRLDQLDRADEVLGLANAVPTAHGRDRGRGHGRGRGRGSARGRGRGHGSRARSSVARARGGDAARSPAPIPRKYQSRAHLTDIKLQRELTAYPNYQSPEDYFRQPPAKDDRTATKERAYWVSDNSRIAAFVAVGALMGGLSKGMDWGLLLRIFPEFKCSSIKRWWANIKKHRGQFIQDLTEMFQIEFLVAYENRELPPIDFANHLEYDWLGLVKWTARLVEKEKIDMPGSRAQLEEEFIFVEEKAEQENWRDQYFHWQRSMFNRFNDATSEAAAAPIEHTPKQEDCDATVTRSWIRALCATEPTKSTPTAIREKFAKIGGCSEDKIIKLLGETIKKLENDKIVIKQNSKALSTGRPWRFTDHFLKEFVKYSRENKYRQAAEFKTQLDEAFRKGETVEIPYKTNDGMILAVINLQSHGRVCIEEINAPDIPYGFKPGFYESRKFPKSHYHFRLRVSPTTRYVYNDDVEILRTVDKTSPPGELPDGKIPLWCDFFGDLDRGRWSKMLASVLFVLATRGAMTTPYATHALRKCFETFEVDVIKDWALNVGLLREVTVGGGVSTTEWWWLVIGSQILKDQLLQGDGPAATDR